MTEDEKNDAVKEVYHKLNEADPTLPDVSDRLSANESIEMFERLSREAKEEQIVQQPSNNHNTMIMIIIIAIVICSATILSVVIIKRRTRH